MTPIPRFCEQCLQHETEQRPLYSATYPWEETAYLVNHLFHVDCFCAHPPKSIIHCFGGLHLSDPIQIPLKMAVEARNLGAVKDILENQDVFPLAIDEAVNVALSLSTNRRMIETLRQARHIADRTIQKIDAMLPKRVPDKE